jgi:hypothetical protein
LKSQKDELLNKLINLGIGNMLNKSIILFLMISISFSLYNCDDSNNPVIKPNGEDTTLTLNYLIFYPLSQSDGWRPEHTGLFYYSFKNSTEPERILTESIVHISSVAKNGTIVFQYEYLPNKFWVRFTDGTTLPIPFPQLDQSDKDYFYSTPPHIELSSDGKKAVFFASIKRLDKSKPEENKLMLIVVNLPELTYTINDVSKFISDNMSGDDVNFCESSGQFFFVNEDATKIIFTIKAKKFSNNQFIDKGYYIIQYSNNNFAKFYGLSSETIELAGFDVKSDKVFAVFGNSLKAIKNGNIINTSLLKDNISNPHQFAVSKSEVAIWTDSGIELYDLNNEQKIKEIITWDTLRSLAPEVKQNVRSNKLSISPDGGLIIFGFDKNTDPPSYDLFAIRRNSSNIKRLVPNTPVGIPVISWGIK